MPAFQLEPSAAGTYAGWTFLGGATRLECVQDDVDNNCIRGVTAQYCTFAMTDLPAAAVSVASPVYHYGRMRQNAGASAQIYATMRYGSEINISQYINPDSTWYDIATAFADCPGSTGWSVAQLNAAEIGEYCAVEGATAGLCTRLYAYGTYYIDDGFVVLLFSLIGSLLGSGIGMEHLPGIARAFWRAKQPGIGRSLITPDEYRRVLAMLRAYRHPRFAF